MLVHQLRSESDAILVGHTTWAVDAPSLTVREWAGSDPERIVLGHGLEGTLPEGYLPFDSIDAVLRHLYEAPRGGWSKDAAVLPRRWSVGRTTRRDRAFLSRRGRACAPVAWRGAPGAPGGVRRTHYSILRTQRPIILFYTKECNIQ